MHRRAFTLGGLSAAAITMGQVANAQDKPAAGGQKNGKHEHHGYTESFKACAKACSDCQRECDRCAIHCAHMLWEGKKHHEVTLQTCLDCADVCGAAAAIVARGGPFSHDICEACADVCKKCAEACHKHGDSPEMKACAKECEKCEAACREMLKSAKGNAPKAGGGAKPGL